MHMHNPPHSEKIYSVLPSHTRTPNCTLFNIRRAPPVSDTTETEWVLTVRYDVLDHVSTSLDHMTH